MQQFQLPNESARSVRLEMVWCPSGPDTTPDLGQSCRTLAYASAFIYQLDSQTHLVTARHNLTGRHWQTNACLGARPVSPTHLRVALLSKPPPEGWRLAPSGVGRRVAAIEIRAKLLLLPLIGPEEFSSVTQYAKYVHNYVSAAFVIGLALIVVLWIKDNLPRKVDIDWVKQGGGFIRSKHAPSGRFNAGEKLVFWFALGAGVAVIISGYLLMFPFYVTDIAGMQIAQVVHAVIAVLFVAVIIAHIYIGTLGMEGAFEAMATGEVDLNWAKEHHDIWLEEQLTKERVATGSGQSSAAPAE